MNTSGFWKKYIIFIVLFALSFGLILWLAVIAQIRIALKEKEVINKKTAEIETLQEKVAKLKEADENSAEIAKAYDTVNNLWPDKDDVGKFIVQSEGLASEKNLVLTSITVAETVLKDTKNTTAQQKSSDSEKDTAATTKTPKKESGIKFTFATESPYSRIFDFVVGMERLARFNSVSQVSISNGAENELILRLTGYIYAK